MEKRISLILFALIFFANNIYSQHEDFQKKIRIPLWAELDAYPGLTEAQDTSSGQFDYPINRLKTISPFLIYLITHICLSKINLKHGAFFPVISL